MPKTANDKLQGTLTLLVLRALVARGPSHGYALCSFVQQASGELLRLEEGSLYPALHRMEQDGWLESSWETTDKGRRAKVYQITARGRKQLREEQESWIRLTTGVSKVLAHG